MVEAGENMRHLALKEAPGERDERGRWTAQRDLGMRRIERHLALVAPDRHQGDVARGRISGLEQRHPVDRRRGALGAAPGDPDGDVVAGGRWGARLRRAAPFARPHHGVQDELAVVAMEVVHPGRSWEAVVAMPPARSPEARMDVHQNAEPPRTVDA